MIVELTIERLAYGGDGVARHEGLVVFVPGTAPGDRVRTRIVETKRRHARAIVLDLLAASPARREPLCAKFGVCGGCQLQHLTRAAQLEIKVGFVTDALRRIGGIQWPRPIPVVTGDEYGYRTRARLQTSNRGEVGFYAVDGHSVVDIDTCPVLAPALSALLPVLHQQRRPPSNEWQIALGNNGVACTPALPDHATTAHHKIGNYEYQVPPAAFFQANLGLLEQLTATAIGDHKGQEALDLFCGAGLFTLPLARRFRSVWAVDSDEQAVACLQQAARRHGCGNISADIAQCEAWLHDNARNLQPDFILLDPPRTGASGILTTLLALRAPELTYVACDPTTLARDLAVLVRGGMRLVEITAFDMFPQTYHVEVVARLQRDSRHR